VTKHHILINSAPRAQYMFLEQV